MPASVINSVTVYCSSSDRIPAHYFEAATALGAAIAAQRWTLVYGGNFMGLMAAVASGARGGGGRVVGITPRKLHEMGYSDTAAHELILTDTMRQRKQLLEERSDAFIALPGGLGTFEELFEIIVGRQLKFHAKPIVLFNVDGYFDPLLAMMEHGITQHFIKENARELYFVATSVEQVLAHLQSGVEPTKAEASVAAGQPPSGIE